MLPSQSKSSISLPIFLSQSKSLNYGVSSILRLYYSTVSCTWSWSNILIHFFFFKRPLNYEASSILRLYYSTVSCTWSRSNILNHLIYIYIYIYISKNHSSIKIGKKLLMMDLTIVRKCLIYLAYKPYVRLTYGPYNLGTTYQSRIR